MATVNVETTNGEVLSFEHGKFNSKKNVTEFLQGIEKALQEDDIITLYSMGLEEKDEYYRMTFSSTYVSMYDTYENYYRIDQIDLSEGEKILKEFYSGSDSNEVHSFIWNNRKLFNQGFMETV